MTDDQSSHNRIISQMRWITPAEAAAEYPQDKRQRAREALANAYQGRGLPKNAHLIRSGQDPFLGTAAALDAIEALLPEAAE